MNQGIPFSSAEIMVDKALTHQARFAIYFQAISEDLRLFWPYGIYSARKIVNPLKWPRIYTYILEKAGFNIY